MTNLKADEHGIITVNTGLYGKPVKLVFLPPNYQEGWVTVADFGDGISAETLLEAL